MSLLVDLTILLNNTCNLRCRYCRFVETAAERFAVCSRERALAAVRLFFEHARERPDASRVLCLNADGEALASRELLFEALELASSLRGGDRRTIVALVTNGTLVDAHTAGELARLGVSVTVSIDGEPEVHDRHRRDAEGTPTQRKVAEGIAHLRAAGVPLGFRAVVTPETSPRIEETYRYLASLRPALPVKLRPVRQPGPPFYAPEWVERFAMAYADCVRRLIETGTPVEALPDDAHHLARLLTAGRGRGSYCPAGHGMLWMSPDGALSPCGLLTGSESCGNIDGVPDGAGLAALVDRAPSLRVRERSPGRRDPCASCRWLPACQGGCPALALEGPPPLCGFYRRLGETLEEMLRPR